MEPVEQWKEQELLCFCGTSEPISARMIRESCGNLNLRADLYLPVVLLLLTSRGNKSAVLQVIDWMAEEIFSALFSMNLGKCAIDFKIEEVLLPEKTLFFHKITYQSSVIPVLV